jgi:hypothetical protein
MKLFFSIILFFSLTLVGQERLEINRIIIDNYPSIRAEVKAYDAAGVEYREFADEPITLTEDGTQIPLTLQECEQDLTKFSLIVLADVSASMRLGLNGESDPPDGLRRVDALQRSLVTLVTGMNFTRSEFSLITFAGRNEVSIEYAQNRDSIIGILNSGLRIASSTDFNAAFLGKDSFTKAKVTTGAIEYAKNNAKWKPVILFFSDGDHGKTDDSDVWASEIADSAAAAGCLVFSAQYGGSTPASISTIVSDPRINGKSYPPLNTEQDIEQTFIDILREVERNPTALPPCEIEWITDCDQNEILVEGLVNGSPVSATATYAVPDNMKPTLEIDNRNPVVLNNGNTQITVTARNAKVTLSGADFSDGNFNFVEDLATLPPIQKDQSIILNVTHTDATADCTPVDISFNSTACFGNDMNASSGFLSAQNVTLTGATPGQPLSSNEDYFNNNFCSDITITNIRIENGDAQFFSVNFTNDINVPQGQTSNFEFTYTPNVPGTHTADLVITTQNNGEYRATITGTSTGLPNIATTSTQPADVVCNETSELEIEITNSGPVPMDVTNIIIDNTTDFRLKNPALTSFTVAENNGSETVVIIFDPQSEGVKNAIVTIENNSDNDQNRQVNITGTELDLDFTAQRSSIPLGKLCPTETISFAVEIDNTGEAGATLNFEDNNSEITFNDNSTQLVVQLGETGATKNLTFDPIGLPTGPFSREITIRDDCGNLQEQITVEGTIENASAQFDGTVYNYGTNSQVLAITSDLNITERITIPITNLDDRALSNIVVSKVSDPDNVFTIVSNDPTADANGSFDVIVDYTPKDSKSYILRLSVSAEINGNLCLNQDLTPLTTGATVPNADITSSDKSALIGQQFTITPDFIDNNNFFSAGINNAIIDISVPSNLIESVDGIAPTINGDKSVYRYEFDVNNPQTINFIALNPNDENINNGLIEFEFIDTDPSGRGTINNSSINFNLIRAKAKIEIDEVTAKPGERVVFSLNSDDFDGVEPDFHRAINGRVKFNASLLYPLSEDKGDIVQEGDKHYRYIDFSLDLTQQGNQSGKDITTSVQDANLTMEFIALLGDSESTELEVINPTSEIGEIEFETIVLGTFNLDPTCVNETGQILRFFDPFGTEPGITINGNPANGITSVDINIIEDGNHTLKIVDLNGNVVHTFIDDFMQHGFYSYQFETSGMINGNYQILLSTPTQLFNKPLIIIN